VSSAILYVAIVAIWACVLIPRWLHRSGGHTADPAVPEDVVRGDVVSDSGEDNDDRDILGEDIDDADVPAEDAPGSTVLAGYTETVRTVAAVWTAATADRASRRRSRRREAAPVEPPESRAETDARPPLAPEESRRRMLAARRRLLGMLVILEVAAIALDAVGLAALWVLIPPSVMLIGYLLLLREAAHADAERAQREEEAARARARARTRGQARPREHATAAPPAAPQAPAARYEDPAPGRDFAPGLAGKYTTSTAEVIDISEGPDEDFRDEYQATKLRAVGD
jgi:hypothetical protein